jgi:hypothetical protein
VLHAKVTELPGTVVVAAAEMEPVQALKQSILKAVAVIEGLFTLLIENACVVLHPADVTVTE